MIKPTTLLYLSILFLLAGKTAVAQPADARVEELMRKAMETFHVAGAAIGVVKDGKVIHAKGYGLTSVDSGTPVDEHTNFAIASNSKAFTTAALALLVEEGKLAWGDKVKDHIPEFRMHDPYVTENFIIEDLITHRSGLPLGMGDLMFFPDGADFTMDDLLSNLKHFAPVTPFRTQFDYDNLLYIVAGELIKRVSGMPWEEFVSRRLFEPLQMDRTYASLIEATSKGNLARPQANEGEEIREIEPMHEMINGAAGGIISNVDDLCNWMLVHLNEGAYGDSLQNHLFSPFSQRKMWTIHTVQDARADPKYNTHFAGYGLGWFLSDKGGNMAVEHTGGLPGMLSRTFLIPDIELGIVVLTNTHEDGAGLFTAVTNTLVDHYLGLEPTDWIGSMSSLLTLRRSGGDSVTEKVWDQVDSADASHIDPRNYIGIYEDAWFGKMEVLEKDGQLWMKSHRSPKLNGPMYFYQANTFAIKWAYRDMNCDAFAMFTLDQEGIAQGIKMKGISPNIDFSFDFHDLDLKRVE